MSRKKKSKTKRKVENTGEVKEELRKKIFKYRKARCTKCGYNKCRGALDFHHKNPKDKKFSIGTGIRELLGWDIIKKEIDKCIVLCSNCHREFHFNKEKIRKYKNDINR